MDREFYDSSEGAFTGVSSRMISEVAVARSFTKMAYTIRVCSKIT